MKRNSEYSILIICEGEKTEPLFFNSIRDRIIDIAIIKEEKEQPNIRRKKLKVYLR